MLIPIGFFGGGAITVTGGIITSDATYYYRTFTSNGTLTVTGGSLSADLLIVAGGGGGGTSGYNGGGGAGAGGYRAISGSSLNAGSYSVVVGAGGAGGGTGSTAAGSNGSSGSNSSIAGYTAAGGGGGAGGPGPYSYVGSSGGSGGGGSGGSAGTGGAGNTPSVSPSQGNNGGTSASDGYSMAAGGGGGGAGAAGANGVRPSESHGIGGNGGAGLQWVNGTYYAGGGGGSIAGTADAGSAVGVGGTGGGGSGTMTGSPAGSGIANLGGGGGGGYPTGTGVAGSGGSGIVIVRYLKSAISGGPVQSWQTDLYAAYLKLATPMSTGLSYSDYSATIYGSGTNRTVTATNSPTFSTSVSKYYGSSLNLGAYTDNKYVSVPRTTDLQIGTNDFTIEGWFYFTTNSVGYQALASHAGDTGDSQPGWILITETNNYLNFYAAGSGGGWSVNVGSTTAPTANAWSHIAVTRTGSTLRMFMNGVQIGINSSASGSIGLPSSRELRVGSYTYFPGGARGMSGYIQDFRFYVGACKYTTSFTPPSAIYIGA